MLRELKERFIKNDSAYDSITMLRLEIAEITGKRASSRTLFYAAGLFLAHHILLNMILLSLMVRSSIPSRAR